MATRKKAKTEEPKAEPEVAITEQPQEDALAVTTETVSTAVDETAVKIERTEDIVNRLAEAVVENTDNIRKSIQMFQKKLKLQNDYLLDISKQAKEMQSLQEKAASLIKDINDRLTAVEERERAARKSTGESFIRLNSRLQSLERPKAAVIEIKAAEEGGSYILPAPAKDGSIGDDLYTTRDIWVEHGRNIVPLDICINIPRGIEGKIEARSGFSARGIYGKVLKYVSEKIFWFIHKPAVEVEVMENMNADVINGKVDPGYHDSIGILIYNRTVPFMIPAGTRLAQITYYKTVNHRYKKVEEFSTEEPYVADRNGGFGSSNKEEKND